ncbi:MAG: phosphoglycerate mutase [Xanthomonadaceae bacterium]|jgi:hypothetical protein|nr:phosphoglycerate mutase [Xanthomonadaceae bacterium]
MGVATVLLPPRALLPATGLPPAVGKALARADREQSQPGPRAQLRRHFRLLSDAWPAAALTRQWDEGDAAPYLWLRADPAYIVPDVNGARMFGHGAMLALAADDIEALLPDLRPLFGDAGFELDMPNPARWYLRLPSGTPLPVFADPDQALGESLTEYLPEGDSAAARRWRILLNDVQMLLHQHPWNQRRAAQGKPEINSLWFWGAGTLPELVGSRFGEVRSRDPLLLALAQAGGIATNSDAARPDRDLLIDLRHLRSGGGFVEQVMEPMLQALQRHEIDSLVLDFEDGVCFTLHPGQRRWHFWLKPMIRLDAR